MRLHALTLAAMALLGCGGGGSTTTPTGDSGTNTMTTTVNGHWASVMIGTSVDLYGLYGSGARSLIAVGPQTIRMWNGSAWSAGPDTELTLRGVGGAGATTFIIGMTVPPNGSAETGMGVILRLMSTAATEVNNPAPAIQFTQAWGRADNDIWAIGQDSALHWNGSTWMNTASLGLMQGPMSSPASDLYAVWGIAADDIRAVGKLVYHWNGSAWTQEPQPGNDYYYGIWGSSARDVWMVGSGVARHWNGTEWSDVRVGTQNILRAIWGVAANDIWAVGDNGTIVHYDGARWTAIPSGTTQTLRAVWGSSASDVWAVGQSGACVHYTL